MRKSIGRKKTTINYKKRKTIFLTVLLLLFVMLTLVLFPKRNSKETKRFTTSGICGCVNQSAVYRLPVGSNLGTLIMKAKGITYNADIRDVDLDQTIKQDSIYHIASLHREHNLNALTDTVDTISFHPDTSEKQFTFLYIGFPALYFLVTYFPEQNKISVLYLPHSTILLHNEYRLIDIYFTLGLEPTIDVLEKQLNRGVDYYFVQDRDSFIDMVDALGEIELPIDPDFAKTYNLSMGTQLLDGFQTWEFIRFIDKKHFKAKKRSANMASMSNLELAYDMRQMRQKQVIFALERKFNAIASFDKIKVVKDIVDLFNSNSNLTKEAALDLLQNLKKGTEIYFGTLPGYYQIKGDNLFYFPDKPGFDMIKNKQIREVLKTTESDRKQILY